MDLDLISLVKDAEKKARRSLIGLILVFLLSLFLFLFPQVFSGSDKPTFHDEASNRADITIKKFDIDNINRNISEIESDIYSLVNDSSGENSERLKELEKEKQKHLYMLNVNTQEIEKMENKYSTDVQDVISNAITRIGAVMLSVFMMQILLSFYRYFLRLSTYYKSKLLAYNNEESPEKRTEIINTISPDHVTFGNQPQLGIEKMVEIIKLTKQA